MGRTLGVQEILAKRYKVYPVSQEWADTVGILPQRFTMLVFGKPKNGKTSFVMKLCKYLTQFGKVYYNSGEEGDSATIQNALIVVKMEDVAKGMFVLGDQDTYDEMVEKLKKNRAVFVVIDSIDYIYMTKSHFERLTKMFPNKSFIVLSWEKAREPKTQAAKDIKHMVGCVVHVKAFVAHTEGRYGGGDPYVIWDRKKAAPQTEQMTIPLETA